MVLVYRPLSTDYNPLPPEDSQLQAILPPAKAPTENPPWSLWDVIAIALVALGAISVCGLIGGAIAIRIYKLTPVAIQHNSLIAVPTEAVAYLVTLIFMAFVVRSRRFPFWKTIGWHWPKGILRYAVVGFVLAISIGFLSNFLPIPKQLPIEKYFANTTGAWVLAIFGVTLAPFMEELFFRGFLYPVLARPLGMIPSIIITSLAFALIHSPQLATAWAPLLLILTVGLVITTLRANTRSLIPGLMVHIAYNLTLFVVFFQQTGHFHSFDKIGG